MTGLVFLEGVEASHGGDVEGAVGGDGGAVDGAVHLDRADDLFVFFGGEDPEPTAPCSDIESSVCD